MKESTDDQGFIMKKNFYSVKSLSREEKTGEKYFHITLSDEGLLSNMYK
jgi:hypothetical protein